MAKRKPKGKHYKKLVRDELPEDMTRRGIPYMRAWVVSGDKLSDALHEKFFEEVHELEKEYRKGKKSKLPRKELAKRLAKELVDVGEVADALHRLPQYGAVRLARRRKRQRLGGFDKGIMMEGIDDRERDD